MSFIKMKRMSYLFFTRIIIYIYIFLSAIPENHKVNMLKG